MVTLGVETDVLGLPLDEISDADRQAVIEAHPRPDFKRQIMHAFYEGMADRADTTFGTMNDDVLARSTSASSAGTRRHDPEQRLAGVTVRP